MSSYRTTALLLRWTVSLLLALAAAFCAPTGHGHTTQQPTHTAPAPTAAPTPSPAPHPHPPVSCSPETHLAQTAQQPRPPRESASPTPCDACPHPARATAEGPAPGAALRTLRGPAAIRPGRDTLLIVCRWRV